MRFVPSEPAPINLKTGNRATIEGVVQHDPLQPLAAPSLLVLFIGLNGFSAGICVHWSPSLEIIHFALCFVSNNLISSNLAELDLSEPVPFSYAPTPSESIKALVVLMVWLRTRLRRDSLAALYFMLRFWS